jgi:hypothetical protein
VGNDHPEDSYVYLGNGPAATGGGDGWNMSAELTARCRACGGFVSLDPTEYGNCPCDALHKDPNAGRIGSSFGDAAIEIYRHQP